MKTEKEEDAQDSKQQLCRANREEKLCSKSRFRELGGECLESLGLGTANRFPNDGSNETLFLLPTQALLLG